MTSNPPYRRRQFAELLLRLGEPRRFMTIVVGPRQVGKTTLVRQVLAQISLLSHFASADDPGLSGTTWIEVQWQAARTLRRESADGVVLALDEVQKIPGWSETIKKLWDQDTASGLDLRVVLLGSSPLLMQRGLTESLAGSFETIRLAHWSFAEMRAAFGWDLDQFLCFGGYPGAASLVGDTDRWRAYMLDSLIEPTLSRDLLLMTRVDKPALLRQLFRIGTEYWGQVVSFNKLLGQMTDAGNTTTLAHYLELLDGAGLLGGLQKFGTAIRRRGSSPKLLVRDTGLMTAVSGKFLPAAKDDREYWGRLVESAVGAHLLNTAQRDVDVDWWRESNLEVDYVLSRDKQILALEVASGRRKSDLRGLDAFSRRYPSTKLLIGAQGLPLDIALTTSADELLSLTA